MRAGVHRLRGGFPGRVQEKQALGCAGDLHLRNISCRRCLRLCCALLLLRLTAQQCKWFTLQNCVNAGSTVIEICLGLGPCGELRYPAYQEAPDKWSYMGRGDMSVQSGAAHVVHACSWRQCDPHPMHHDANSATGDVASRHPGHRRVPMLRPLHAGGPAQGGGEGRKVRLVRSPAVLPWAPAAQNDHHLKLPSPAKSQPAHRTKAQLPDAIPAACRGVPPGIGAGVYSSSPWETSFLALTEDAGWKSPYGQFFLKWYSEKLIKCAAIGRHPHLLRSLPHRTPLT